MPHSQDAYPENLDADSPGDHIFDEGLNLRPPPQLGRLFSEIQPEKISWAWPGRIAYGKLALVVGDPGVGKSLVTMDIGARITRGLPMPDGSRSDPAKVLYATDKGFILLNGEDDAADTLVPRFLAADGDLARALDLASVPDTNPPHQRPFLLPNDLDVLRLAIHKHGAQIVVIDPLNAFMAPGLKANSDQDVRRALQPAARLAAETGAAIVIVAHLNKVPGASPLQRVAGSIGGLIGTVRSALVVVEDPDDKERRILAPLKSNRGRLAPSLAFQIVAGPDGNEHLRWLGASKHDKDTLLAASQARQEPSALDEAQDFLRHILQAGPQPAKKIKAQAREAGISHITLDRAKHKLRIRSHKEPGERGQWLWSLPTGNDQRTQAPQGPHANGAGPPQRP